MKIAPWFAKRETSKFCLVITTKPLYATAYIRDVALRHALVDSCFTLNIMPLTMLEAVGIPRDRTISVRFRRVRFGYINLDLTMNPYEQPLDFMSLVTEPLIVRCSETLDPQA